MVTHVSAPFRVAKYAISFRNLETKEFIYLTSMYLTEIAHIFYYAVEGHEFERSNRTTGEFADIDIKSEQLQKILDFGKPRKIELSNELRWQIDRLKQGPKMQSRSPSSLEDAFKSIATGKSGKEKLIERGNEARRMLRKIEPKPHKFGKRWK